MIIPFIKSTLSRLRFYFLGVLFLAAFWFYLDKPVLLSSTHQGSAIVLSVRPISGKAHMMAVGDVNKYIWVELEDLRKLKKKTNTQNTPQSSTMYQDPNTGKLLPKEEVDWSVYEVDTATPTPAPKK